MGGDHLVLPEARRGGMADIGQDDAAILEHVISLVFRALQEASPDDGAVEVERDSDQQF